jgi:hypothetical protein
MLDRQTQQLACEDRLVQHSDSPTPCVLTDRSRADISDCCRRVSAAGVWLTAGFYGT